jgi:hypothetical protein
MQLSSNALESHSISLKMCNQAKRWVEGLFSSSKDVSRSQNVQEMPLNPGQLLFIAKGYVASRYWTTQWKTWWSDAPVRVTGRVQSLQDKQQLCASEGVVVVTGRTAPGVWSVSRELPPWPDMSDRMWPDTPRVRSALRHALPLWVPDRTLRFCEELDVPVVLLSSAPRWTDQTRWSGQTSVRSRTLGELRLYPRLELTGCAGPPWTASGPASGHCFFREKHTGLTPLFLRLWCSRK